jgi:hypothetical protein
MPEQEPRQNRRTIALLDKSTTMPVFTAPVAASQKLEIGSALVDAIVTITESRAA